MSCQDPFESLPRDILRYHLFPKLNEDSLIPLSLVNKFVRSLVIERFEQVPDRLYLIAKDYLGYAAESGNLNLTKWAYDMGCRLPKDLFVRAAKGADYKTFRFLFNELHSMSFLNWFSDKGIQSNVARYGKDEQFFEYVQNGHWGLIKKGEEPLSSQDLNPYVQVQRVVDKQTYLYRRIRVAFRHGNVNFIRWCVNKKGKELFEELFQGPRSKAAPKRQPVGGKAVLELGFELLGENFMNSVNRFNLYSPDMDTLNFMKENLLNKLDDETLHNAAERSNLETFRYLYEVMLVSNIKNNMKLVERATLGGKLDTVKYLSSLGYSIDSNSHKERVQNKHDEAMHWMSEEGEAILGEKSCEYAAKGGYLKILKYLMEEKGLKCIDEPGVMEEVASAGHLQVLTYLHKERGLELNGQIYVRAAKEGHVHILEYAKRNGCKLPKLNKITTCHPSVEKWIEKNQKSKDCIIS